MKVLVLTSGGMDSAVALHQAHRDYSVLSAVSFHYGSKHNDREIPFAAGQCQRLEIPHKVVPLDFINKLFASNLLQSGGAIPEGHYEEATMRQTVVPFRNGIMLAVAAGYAESIGADAVVIAAHTGDHVIYPDCREAFMTELGRAMELGTYAGIKLLRPFIGLSKSAIATRGRELGVDFSQTWSCYNGGEIHCGRCGTCIERREAFALAGISDPTVYETVDPIPARPGA